MGAQLIAPHRSQQACCLFAVILRRQLLNTGLKGLYELRTAVRYECLAELEASVEGEQRQVEFVQMLAAGAQIVVRSRQSHNILVESFLALSVLAVFIHQFIHLVQTVLSFLNGRTTGMVRDEFTSKFDQGVFFCLLRPIGLWSVLEVVDEMIEATCITG